MRMGGDEFLIFLDEYNENQVKNLIRQIKLLCNDSKLVLEDGTEIEGPTTAIGYAIRPNSDQNLKYIYI